MAFGPGVIVRSVAFRENHWFVSAEEAGRRSCPKCGQLSSSRHSWRVRRLQDLPIQGTPVVVELRLGRWRCRNEQCPRKILVERLTNASPFAPKTRRVSEDVLETRSAKDTADWLKQRPEIEVVSRDRCGLCAQGARQGAPQARQLANRLHPLQNFRESIERQMTEIRTRARSTD